MVHILRDEDLYIIVQKYRKKDTRAIYVNERALSIFVYMYKLECCVDKYLCEEVGESRVDLQMVV